MSDTPAVVALRYRVRPVPEAWVLPEIPVPEARAHDLLLRYLVELLEAWARRSGRAAIVARNLAVRWYEDAPRVGIDPDVALIEPAPPEAHALTSLCLWKPGHVPPRLAIEVVSPGHPYKDYRDIHEKYAACGVGELWVLDPELAGPPSLGGPVPIQQWMRRDGALERVSSGDGPFFSEAVGAWLWSKPIRISDDPTGESVWLEDEESERRDKETERERRVAAEARVAELERRLKER